MSDQIHDEEERDLIDMASADLRAMPLYRSAPERIGLAIGDELEDWNSEFHDCEEVTWYSGEPPVQVCIGYVRADLVEYLEQCLKERTAEINELTTLRAQLSEAQSEAHTWKMQAERTLTEREALQARLAEIERQEPVGFTHPNSPGGVQFYKPLPALTKLYAGPFPAAVKDSLTTAAPVSPAAPSLNEPQHYCASCRYVGFTTSELESHGGTCPMCNDGDHIFEFNPWPPHVLPVSPAAQVAQGVADDVADELISFLVHRGHSIDAGEEQVLRALLAAAQQQNDK